MNRLIIVGNGFDLAHGLKTSYCHFISDYLIQVLNTILNQHNYDDPLISIQIGGIYLPHHTPLNFRVSEDNVFETFHRLSSLDELTFNIKSNLLIKTINKASTLNWVDIENEYFDELKIIAKNIEFQDDNEQSVKDLKTLNQQFSYLRNRLEEYLKTIQIDPKVFKKDPSISKIFFGEILSQEIVLKKIKPAKPTKTVFLNFNYTNTLINYSKTTRYSSIENKIVDSVIEINHIHGVLDSNSNEMIFGYGDEFDDEYIKFEKLKINELFRHIKSFAYFKTQNYHNLIRFINSDEFQVLIIGHSCGLSDRTMFKKIFEHTNCLSIKVFYYENSQGVNDFTEKTYEIARHFSNKGDMRDKLVPEPLSTRLPQYDNNLINKK